MRLLGGFMIAAGIVAAPVILLAWGLPLSEALRLFLAVSCYAVSLVGVSLRLLAGDPS